MSDGAFEHLELSGDESSVPERVKGAFYETTSARFEFGFVSGTKIMAVRVDGGKVYYGDDEIAPPWFQIMLDYVGAHGITPAFKDFAQSLDREVVLVASLPARDSSPRIEHAQVELPAEEPPSFPSPALQKASRVAALIFGALLWLLWQYYYYQLPARTRSRLESKEWQRQIENERHDDAVKKALRNF